MMSSVENTINTISPWRSRYRGLLYSLVRIAVTSRWASWCLKSSLYQLSTQQFGQAHVKPNISQWDEITYPFRNFNNCTVGVWERISNVVATFKMDVITY